MRKILKKNKSGVIDAKKRVSRKGNGSNMPEVKAVKVDHLTDLIHT